MFKPLLASTIILLTSVPAWAGDTEVAVSATIESEPNYESIQTYRVSDRTYEVYYYGDRNVSRREVLDRAMYKAAKKTLSKGYDWFRVVNRETERETQRSARSRFQGGFYTVPERRCGLLSCSTRTRTYYRGDVNTGFPDRKDTAYTVILEIEMGEGYIRNDEGVYDARIVKRSYR